MSWNGFDAEDSRFQKILFVKFPGDFISRIKKKKKKIH